LIEAFSNIIYISQRDVKSKGQDSSLHRNVLNITYFVSSIGFLLGKSDRKHQLEGGGVDGRVLFKLTGDRLGY
jgi:hypothetical protein